MDQEVWVQPHTAEHPWEAGGTYQVVRMPLAEQERIFGRRKVSGAPMYALDPDASVAVAPDHSHVYIADNGSGRVSVLNTRTNKIVATVRVGKQPSGVGLSPDGQHLYVPNSGSIVSVLDTRTNRVTATITVGSSPVSVAVSRDGTAVYVANAGSRSLSVIDTRAHRTVRALPADRTPVGVTVTPDGRSAYVADEVTASLSVVANPNRHDLGDRTGRRRLVRRGTRTGRPVGLRRCSRPRQRVRDQHPHPPRLGNRQNALP